MFLRSAKLLQAAKLCPSVLVQRAAASFPWSFLGHNCCFGFRAVKVYCNSDNALAGLIREIRNVSLYVPGFQLCELEEFVYVASTFNPCTNRTIKLDWISGYYT